MDISSLIGRTRFSLLTMDRNTVENHWDGFSLDHRDGYSRLYLIKEGDGGCTIEGEELFFRKNDLVLIPAGALLKLNPSRGLDHIWLHFDCMTEEGLPLFDLIKPGFYQKKASREDELYFTQIQSLKTDDEILDKVLHDSLLKLLVLPFLRGARHIVPSVNRNEEKDRWLYQVLSILNTRLDEELTIGELARQIGCHPTYLSNAFSRKFGISPRSYLVKRRIRLSQQLLWHGHAPVKEVARLCGFRDIYYFHRCFRQQTGYTPGQYRKRSEVYSGGTRG